MRVFYAAMLLVLLPLAQADPVTLPVLPEAQESTEELVVEETCDPLELVICVGPISHPMPVWVAVDSSGVNVTIWWDVGAMEPFGPVQENATVPVINLTVPVSVCPNTCPLPALPEPGLTGHLVVCIGTPNGTACATVVDEPWNFWEKPCDGTESWQFSGCTRADGYYQFRVLGLQILKAPLPDAP